MKRRVVLVRHIIFKKYDLINAHLIIYNTSIILYIKKYCAFVMLYVSSTSSSVAQHLNKTRSAAGNLFSGILYYLNIVHGFLPLKQHVF